MSDAENLRDVALYCDPGGCLIAGSNFPSGIKTTSSSSWTVVSTVIYAGEYAYYSVTSGQTYEWSLLAADGGNAPYDSELTLRTSDGSSAICYSDDEDATDDAKIQWTADFTGTVQVLVTQWNCATNTTATTLVWRCTTCGTGSAPANDNCANATTLTVFSGSTCGGATNGTVDNATTSSIATCSGTAEDDVWYKFVASANPNHVITVVGSASFDAVVELRTTGCAASSLIACADVSYSGETEIINATGLTPGNTYYVRVFDYWSSAPTTKTFSICVTTPDYCTASFTYGTDAGDYIDGVQVGTISNTSSGTTGGPAYNDYTGMSTNLQAGASYSITLTNGDYDGETMVAWIDYDQDHTFEGGEKLGETASLGVGASTQFNFTVPAGATLGATILRVRAVWSEVSVDPCLNYSFGETEDYTVNITPSCTTPGTPVSQSTSGIGTSGATLNWAAGTPAGSATVTYYWAISTTGGVTYESGYSQRGTTTSTSVAVGSLSPGTTYYWNVKAVTSCNSTASSYATQKSFSTTCSTPGTPVSLVTSGITNNGATFTWAAGTPVGSPTVTYYWAVGTGSGVTYEAGYTDRGTTTLTTAESYVLTANTSYYWTVKAVTSCNSTASSYPSSIYFTTTTIPTPLIVWDGSSSTDWAVAANWTPEQVPTVTDNVLVPSGCPNYPILGSGGLSVNCSTTSKVCKSITIASGATVRVTSTLAIDVQGDFDIFGEFNHQPGTYENLFKINSGGSVNVKSTGILNIGSDRVSGGIPGTTSVNQFNDIYINGGTLSIEPGGKVFVMDNLVITGSGILNMEGGELWIKYYGDGSTNSYGFDLYATANVNISAGDVFLCGQDGDGGSSQMADWNASSTVSVTGGTFHIRNEQSSGTLNYAALLDLGGKTINSLEINRSGAQTTLANYPLPLTADFTMTAGTFNADVYNMTIAGNITSNGGTFNAGTGTMTLTGTSNTISGSSASQFAFNGLTFQSGSNYTFNPSGVTNFDVNGSLNIESGATVNIASGKYLDIYSSTAGGEAITINGTVNATDNYNGSRDLDINNAVSLIGTGSINADIRVFDDVLTLTNDQTINGDVEMYDNTTFQGTFAFSGSETLNVGGSWTNNFGLTANSGTIVFTGSGKTISGDSPDDFNNLIFATGASYTINPTTVNDINVDGSFVLQEGATLNIASGKYLDIYASTADGETVTFDGDIVAVSAYNSTQDIDLNNTVSFSGNGTTNADLRIYSGTSTLTSDFDLDGDFTILGGATFEMDAVTQNNLKLSGSWTNGGTFTKGLSLVTFDGAVASRIINAGGLAKPFNDVVVDRSSGTIKIYNSYMQINGSLDIISGTLSAGDAAEAYRLNLLGPTTIYDGAVFNSGKPSVGEAAGGATVTTFQSDLTVHGQITTDRTVISGYADIFIFPSKLMGDGDADEVNCDVQIFAAAPTEQIGDLWISGDLIVQTVNSWITNNPNSILTIGGNLYIYHNFTHKGTVNLYGNFRENTATDNDAEIVNIDQSIFNMYGNKFINFNPSSGFGKLNIKTGTRSIHQAWGLTPYTTLDIVGDLTIDDGATLDAGTGGKNINIAGNWINDNTTDGFVEGTKKVTFNGSNEQILGGAGLTTFYDFEANNASSTGIVLANSTTVSHALTLTDGYIISSPNKLLILNDNATSTSGSAESFVDGPLKKFGDETFVYPLGDVGVWARVQLLNVSGALATDAFTVEYHATEYPSDHGEDVTGALDHASIVEYWDIVKNNGSPTKKVAIYSEDKTRSGIDDFNNSDLLLAHWNGSAWESTNTGDINDDNSGTGATGWIRSDNWTTFSPFTFSSKSPSNPLDVDLLTFEAEYNKTTGYVDLSWLTASETNNALFTVERTVDFDAIEVVGNVPGAGTSNQVNAYYLPDTKPLYGHSYYRLKQTDYDGSSTTFGWKHIFIEEPAVAAQNANGASNALSIINVFPNPTRDNVFVIFSANDEYKLRYEVYSIMGTLILGGDLTSSKGTNQFEINLAPVAKGAYILVVYGNAGKAYSRIIKQ
ncbi:MAG: T9SS type A sorting domain-containing protein [Bacteroidetes bacterium]|nr:T9SS type A sorting domain-containing protein [Bacteroidota bacterium]